MSVTVNEPHQSHEDAVRERARDEEDVNAMPDWVESVHKLRRTLRAERGIVDILRSPDTAKHLLAALKEIRALGITDSETGKDDFHKAAARFFEAWMIADRAVKEVEKSDQ
jgi:hypothetical protein